MERGFFRIPFCIGIRKGVRYKGFIGIRLEKLNGSLNSQISWYRSKMAQLANKNWNIGRSYREKHHEGFEEKGGSNTPPPVPRRPLHCILQKKRARLGIDDQELEGNKNYLNQRFCTSDKTIYFSNDKKAAFPNSLTAKGGQ
jgi:hypothetical protein